MKHAYLLILMAVGLAGASLLTPGCGRQTERAAMGKAGSTGRVSQAANLPAAPTGALASAHISYLNLLLNQKKTAP